MDLDNIAKRGPVFPVQLWTRDMASHAWQKSPLIAGWPTAASTDPQVINQWFGPTSRWARLGDQLAVGMVTGTPQPLFLCVVDVDPRNGGTTEGFPETLTVRTISGGWHLYCVHPEPLRNGVVRQGVDFKATNGFVVIPPSKGYSYLDPDTPIAPLPEWVAQKLLPRVDGPVPTDLPELEPLPNRAEDPYLWSFLCDATDEQPLEKGPRYRRTNWFMKRCRDIGLTDGQIRTALWQYPPALDKDNEQPGWLDADLLRFLAGTS